MEAGILTRTLHIISSADPTIEMALVNHKKTKIDDDETMEKDQNKSVDLAKKSLHDLSQVRNNPVEMVFSNFFVYF